MVRHRCRRLVAPLLSGTVSGAVSRTLSVALVSALFLASADPAVAEPATGWSFHVGAFDVDKSRTAFEAGVEYRWDAFDFWRLDDLVPVAGLTATDDESVFAYGGLRWDLPWRTERFVPTLSFAVSAYEQGDGKDLGGVIEFRSGLDLSWVLDGGGRVGVGIYHLSNGSIHSFNPGEESVIVFWSPGGR